MRPPPCFDDAETRSLIKKLCEKNGIDIQLLTELCEIAQKHSGAGRKEGVQSDISTCIESFLSRSEG